MGVAYKILPHYTYEDYCVWEGRWELIDGIPYAMSPMPRPEHQKIAANVNAEFRNALRKAKCNCNIYQPIDYKISEDTILNPDLLIVCKPITKQFLDFPPSLVVEILSPATALKDRHTKFEIYQHQKIPYYLILDGDNKEVEIYNLSESLSYQKLVLNQQEPFAFSIDNCSFNVTFANIWN
ncbi:MAG: Uma2 family endonuclease [Chitinophagaceae bacterium]